MAYDMSSALEVTMTTEVETNDAGSDLFALGLDDDPKPSLSSPARRT